MDDIVYASDTIESRRGPQGYVVGAKRSQLTSQFPAVWKHTGKRTPKPFRMVQVLEMCEFMVKHVLDEVLGNEQQITVQVNVALI